MLFFAAVLLFAVIYRANLVSVDEFHAPSERYLYVAGESSALGHEKETTVLSDEIQERPDNFSLSQKMIQRIKKFVFFVGYPRSGNSIVAALLDAHPHIVLSHELHFFRNWHSLFRNESGLDRRIKLYNKIYRNSVGALLPGKSRTRTDKGYTLAIKSSWQGKFDDYIEVIGDKGGGAVSHEYIRNTTEFAEHYKELQQMVSVPIKAIHIVRNPYDMIATSTLYEMGKHFMGEGGAALFVHRVKEKYSSAINQRVKYEPVLRLKVSDFFNMSRAVTQLIELMGRENILDVQLRDLVHHPRETLQSILDFLEVSADEKYLEVCKEKVFRKLSHSRNLLRWPDELIRKIQDKISGYSFLRTYNFTND